MARSNEAAPPARKPRSRKPKAEDKPLEAVPDAPATEEAQPEPARGVFIIKSVDEQGNISTDAQPVGVEATEVQTLIELGLNGWRAKIGLDRK